MNKQQLKKLQMKWNQKLKKSGFNDIEYKDGSLKKDGDKNTVGFQNQTLIRDRISWIENIYMEDASAKDRRILALYVQGVHLNDIARKTKNTYPAIRWAIGKALKAYTQVFCGMTSTNYDNE